jgi:dipeptidyl aminopeptidase/acylaminoacyl peptidase
VPLLVLHPVDDQIVKVDQARLLDEAAEKNDLVRVWILPAGAHGLLETADASWTHAVYRSFFERWAGYAESRPGIPGPSAEVVYSAAQTG